MFLSWQSRWDQDDIDTYHDLINSLGGDALTKVKYFHMANKTFQGAWHLLLKTYENPVYFTTRHLNALLELPKVHIANFKEIERLADKAQAHLASLKTWKTDIGEPIITAIWERCLSEELLAEWRKSIKGEDEGEDEFPSLFSMITFLYRTSSYLSQMSKNKKSSKTNNSWFKRKHEQKSTARSLVTLGSKCPLCKDKDHPSFICEKFEAKSVQDQWKTVK